MWGLCGGDEYIHKANISTTTFPFTSVRKLKCGECTDLFFEILSLKVQALRVVECSEYSTLKRSAGCGTRTMKYKWQYSMIKRWVL